jgi:hypothetical protein
MPPELLPPAFVRIDFVSFEPYRVTLDVRSGTSSLPFALHCVLPYRPWALLAAGMLVRWASTSREVRLHLRRGRDNVHVRMTDGVHLVVLDLCAAVKAWDSELTVMPARHVSWHLLPQDDA